MAKPILQQPATIGFTAETDCAAARLKLATDLARTLTADALIKACRAAGIRHVVSAHQGAHALAAATIQSPSSERGR